MRRNSLERGKVTATLMVMMLVITLTAMFLPEATAASSPVEIVSVDPESGPVGETVRVVGEIDIANGSYKILFDGKVGNGNATGMAVNTTFTVPLSAKGNHSVTLVDVASSNQSLPVNFNVTVTEVIIQFQTQNRYDKKPLASVSVIAYFGERYMASGITNETGWIDLQFSYGNYTFKAFWKTVEVGSLDYTVLENATLVLQFETNTTGTIRANTFTNVSYTIEARRYGHLFNTTQIANLTVTRWTNITCPTLTLFVNVLDSKGNPLKNVEVKVHELSSGRVTGSRTTNASGSISLDATFGRYKMRVYNYSAELGRTVVFNETVIDLIEDQQFVVIYCKISNLELSMVVTDYFGQPLPNAMRARVKVEREFEQEYLNVANLAIASDGMVFLPEIGGRYRISIYVMDKLFALNTLDLDKSKVIVFRIDKLVVVGGYPLEVTQLITYISLSIIVAMFALALIYRRLRLRKVPEGGEKEKSL